MSDQVLRQAVDLARLGRFDDLERLAGPGAGAPVAPGHRFARDVLRHLAGLSASPPALEDADELASGPATRSAVAVVAVDLAELAFLRLDRGFAERCAAICKRVSRDDETAAAAAFARAVERLFVGAVDEAEALAAEASSGARSALAPFLLCAATSLRAMCHLELGRDAEAVSTARRASRMARTEQLPRAQYLANAALARVRRAFGQPHLATRILQALLRVAPPAWHEYLAWEFVLADGSYPDGKASGGSAPDLLRRVLAAARAGDAEAFRTASCDALARAEASALLRVDVAVALELIDSSAVVEELSDLAHDFVAGRDHVVPRGLSALEGGAPDARTAIAWVHRRSESTRRLIAVGLPLAAASATTMAKQQRTAGQVETALAILALAGSIEIAELFHEVYGFRYVADIHRNKANTLLKRMRDWLPGGARIERRGELLRLEHETPLLLPDPRCVRTLEDRTLAFLARNPGATARAAAEALGVSLRSAQGALESLVREGDCLRDREHRNVSYRVEDTTFQEPTRA